MCNNKRDAILPRTPHSRTKAMLTINYKHAGTKLQGLISGVWCVWSLWCGGSTQQESSSAEVLHRAACSGQKNKSLPPAWLFIPTNTKALFKDGKVLIREAALMAPSGKSAHNPGHSYKQVIRSL